MATFKNLTGNPAAFPATVRSLGTGQKANEGNIEACFQDLADRTSNLDSRVGGGGGGGGGGHVIQEETSALAQRAILAFLGTDLSAADDAINARTTVSLPRVSNLVGGTVPPVGAANRVLLSMSGTAGIWAQLDLSTPQVTGQLPFARLAAGSAAGNHLSYNGTAWASAALNLAGGSNYVTGKLPLANLADGAAAGVQPFFNGTAWVTIGVKGASLSDANATVALSTAYAFSFTGTAAADRTVTMSATGAYFGATASFIILDPGTHTWTIANGGTNGGNCFVTTAGRKTCVEITYNGVDWVLNGVQELVS